MSPGAAPPLLVDTLMPALMAQFDASKPALLVLAGGPIRREAMILAWPVIDVILPIEIRATYLAILTTFSTMTIGEFVARLAADLAAVKAQAALQAEVDTCLIAANVEANVDTRLDAEIDGA